MFLNLIEIISYAQAAGMDSVIEDSLEKTDMPADDEEDAWMWDRVMQTISTYYTVSRIKLKNIICAATMHMHRIDQMPVVPAES